MRERRRTLQDNDGDSDIDNDNDGEEAHDDDGDRADDKNNKKKMVMTK